MGPYKHTPPKVRKTQPMTKRSKAAIGMGDIETELEMDQLQHALSQAKTMGEKDKILSRFLNRSSSQQEYNIKARGQTPRVRSQRKGGSVSRKRGGGYVTPKKNIIDDNASKRSRLRSEERRKKAIRAAASKKGGGKIMVGYKAGGKV